MRKTIRRMSVFKRNRLKTCGKGCVSCRKHGDSSKSPCKEVKFFMSPPLTPIGGTEVSLRPFLSFRTRSGQLHAPAVCPRKKFLYPLNRRLGEPPEGVQTVLEKRNYLAPARI